MAWFLILAIGAYAYSSTHVLVDNVIGGKSRLYPAAVLGKELVDLKTGTRARLKRDGRPILLVLLSGTECPSCLDESAVWDRLAEQNNRLRVVGVFVGTTNRDVESYIAQRKPAYETYKIAPGESEGALGAAYARPLSVLMDQWGRVEYASGPTGLPAEQQRFAKNIRLLTAAVVPRSQQ